MGEGGQPLVPLTGLTKVADMKSGARILLLAGSSEAREIGASLQSMGMAVQAVVSEPPRGPNPMPVPCQMISFDNADALQAKAEAADLIFDASHGFDGAMTRIGAGVAGAMGLPFATLQRPGWQVSESPQWQTAPSVAEAMPMVRPGARVFSATGWASLPEHAGFPGAVLFLRQTSPHDRAPPFDFVELVFGTAPFSEASEVELFKSLEIDLLICRNLGGRPSRPKLDAALALDLPVILIDRPAPPPGVEVLASVEDALDWIGRQ